ncbi:MAG: hypothetical protein JG769_761 [Oscillospiraceae bacterium]|nr:hypothetical protein [Oscillospiraceae bacterium]
MVIDRLYLLLIFCAIFKAINEIKSTKMLIPAQSTEILLGFAAAIIKTERAAGQASRKMKFKTVFISFCFLFYKLFYYGINSFGSISYCKLCRVFGKLLKLFPVFVKLIYFLD